MTDFDKIISESDSERITGLIETALDGDTETGRKDFKIFMKPFTCYVCGKVWEMPIGATLNSWAYKTNDKRAICSYACMNKYRAQKKKYTVKRKPGPRTGD